MKKWDVSENCSIYRVLYGFCNAYLIVDGEDVILTDTGSKKMNSLLEKNLNKILGGKLVNYLILTHTHYDHCQNAASIKKNREAKIIVNIKESSYLKTGSTPLPKGTSFFTDILTKLGNRYATSWYLYNSVVPDIEIQETYVISDNIKIISTPGHSNGSLTVIVKDKFAIVGDTLFGSPAGSILPHFADDITQLHDTWKDLLISTNCDTFLPGHGKPISRNRLEKEVARLKYS